VEGAERSESSADGGADSSVPAVGYRESNASHYVHDMHNTTQQHNTTYRLRRRREPLFFDGVPKAVQRTHHISVVAAGETRRNGQIRVHLLIALQPVRNLHLCTHAPAPHSAHIKRQSPNAEGQGTGSDCSSNSNSNLSGSSMAGLSRGEAIVRTGFGASLELELALAAAAAAAEAVAASRGLSCRYTISSSSNTSGCAAASSNSTDGCHRVDGDGGGCWWCWRGGKCGADAELCITRSGGGAPTFFGAALALSSFSSSSAAAPPLSNATPGTRTPPPAAAEAAAAAPVNSLAMGVVAASVADAAAIAAANPPVTDCPNRWVPDSGEGRAGDSGESRAGGGGGGGCETALEGRRDSVRRCWEGEGDASVSAMSRPFRSETRLTALFVLLLAPTPSNPPCSFKTNKIVNLECATHRSTCRQRRTVNPTRSLTPAWPPFTNDYATTSQNTRCANVCQRGKRAHYHCAIAPDGSRNETAR
jgi:hypothetical protein